MTPIRLTATIWLRSVGSIKSITSGSVEEMREYRKNRKKKFYVDVLTEDKRYVILCGSQERAIEMVDDMEKRIKVAMAEDFRAKSLGY